MVTLRGLKTEVEGCSRVWDLVTKRLLSSPMDIVLVSLVFFRHFNKESLVYKRRLDETPSK